MLHIRVDGPEQSFEFEHGEGTLEFGRGPRRDLQRRVLSDPCVSRDQLIVEELPNQELRLKNISDHVLIQVNGEDDPLGLHDQRVVPLPAHLRMGNTELHISAEAPTDIRATRTLPQPPSDSLAVHSLQDLGDSPDPATLARWFETVIRVQQAAATSAEFYIQTARAVVTLVGLDRGMVLLRQGEQWMDAAHYTTDPGREPEFSRGVLQEVLRQKKTYYQTVGTAPVRASLQDIEAVVAAPFFDKDQNVIGVVYGSRMRRADWRDSDEALRKTGIRELEAQIIQVLAAAVGAGVERERQQADALRLQLQFEQFFSARLAHELARDPNLLEGRQREVTIMSSDLRDFSRISEQLGPRETFCMMQDIMAMQTSCIHSFDGVVVDYFGDGLLAMWNAPTDQPDHAIRACRAVLAIMRQIPELSEKWGPKIDRKLRLGVGINTGVALVGNTGSPVKFKYGPMGPAVNLASRVEDATKQLGARILVTEATHRHLDESFATRRLCQASLAGCADPVELFELSTESPTPEWQQRQKAFETALEHFHTRRWAEACLDIYPLISKTEGDYDVASLQLLSRAVECLKANPEPFDPVVYIKSK